MTESSKGGKPRRRLVRVTADDLTRREFQRLVAEMVTRLPKNILQLIENVEVVVEDAPAPDVLAESGTPEGQTLYGYYQGVPRHQRGTWYNMALPDKISIYRLPITSDCQNRGQLRRLVYSTVVHEIAHHFGIGDEELKRLGWE